MKKTQLAIVSILALLAVLIVGLGVHRICLERRKPDLYAADEAVLAAHQWNEALRPRGRVGKASPVYDAPETGARSSLAWGNFQNARLKAHTVASATGP